MLLALPHRLNPTPPTPWVASQPSPAARPSSIATCLLLPRTVQALQRRQYTEIPERDLEKRKLQRSLLGVRFHVRDMLGSGALLRLQTTVGPVLRLAHSK